MKAISAEQLEAYVVWPAFVVLVLFIVPVPFLSKLLSAVVRKIEGIRVRGVSPLVVLAGVVAAFGANEFLRLQNYANDTEYKDLLSSVDHRAVEFRAQRNVYLHLTTLLTVAAVLKIARLVDELERATEVQKARKKE